ncbi:MAG: redoxin domain-containing protein [Bacteroidetes bacterium]|nr:redoxin domain-containing protein [Bacteroidota bacterium]
MRKGLVVALLILIFAGIAGIFWYNEWRYSLPTPVPAHYRDVQHGTLVSLPSSAQQLLTGKPLFLHFFNPDCPCSRFNMPQFKALVKEYGSRTNFAIVLMSPKKYSPAQLQQKFDLPYPIPVLQDSAIAVACGVYSTPQAALIDTGRRLYFRGNYNRSRYCSDEKTGYARLALADLLNHNYSPIFSPLALKAYGCQLPTCTK